MQGRVKIFAALLVFVLLIKSDAAFSQVRLPRLIRDSMVLQRDTKLKIWGWAAPGENVNIQFHNKHFKTKAGTDGKWSVLLPPMKAGGPYTMRLDASNHLLIKDILIGDVWLCSGQSNMVHQLALHKERYAAEIAEANAPQIRQFWVPAATDLQQPHDDVSSGNWICANPQDVLQFSAVAYFFAKALYEKYGVPIGLINASVGGTPIEAWTSADGLKDFQNLMQTIEKNKDTTYVNEINRNAFAARAAERAKQLPDKGLINSTKWYDTAYVPKEWHEINIPGYWEDQGLKDLDGVVWYRKEVDMPQSMVGLPAKIALGRIVDADFLYVNGVQVGRTSYQYPQRRYSVPAGLLKPGKNILVVRVLNYADKGGFVPDKPYYLRAGEQTLDLKGTWQYKVGAVYQPQPNNVQEVTLQNQPASLFNAMIAPLTNYKIKGVLWYQGESNIGNASAYGPLLQALIQDWRAQWNEGVLPFIYVQLPNFGDVQFLPAESSWAELREAQRKTLYVLNTGMTVTIDLGEWNDIHPDNKKDVGVRSAWAAEKVAYGEKNMVYSGPLYQSLKIDSNKISLMFRNTGSGLVSSDGEELRWFTIAGAAKKFVPARAKIEGNTVVIWSDEIVHPMYVRYAWADNPQDVNFYNKEGLPAAPFETD